MAKPVFFLLVCVLCIPVLGHGSSTEIDRLARSAMWHKLLHYNDSVLAFELSEADGSSFFLSPHGRSDATTELWATIRAFQQKKRLPPHNRVAQCVFPARLLFLQRALSDRDRKKLRLQAVDCPEYERFRQAMRTDSVSLVFASPFLRNPASMFGHTFLRFETDPDNPLLGHAVSFEANIEDMSTLSVIFGGLFGLLPGQIFIQPYFEKVRSYNDIESRSLFEYQLNLTKNSIELITAHLWELGSTHFNYRFLSENCSYHILGLLDLARTDLNLRDDFFWYTVPSDTVRSLVAEAGLVEKRIYRPSLFARLHAGWQALEKHDQRGALLLAEGRSETDDSQSWTNEVLDTAILYLRYQNEAGKEQRLHQLQTLRAVHSALRGGDRKTIEKTDVSVAAQSRFEAPPEAGHAPGKLSLSAGYLDEQFFQQLAIRLTYHDLLDDPTAYLPFSQLVVGRIALRRRQRRIYLDELTLIELKNLQPIRQVYQNWAWQLRLAVDTPDDIECGNCLQATSRFGVGGAFSVIESASTYVLLNVNAHYLPAWSRNFRFGPSLEAGLNIIPHRKWRALLAAEQFYFLPQPKAGEERLFSRFSLGLAHSLGRGFEARAQGTLISNASKANRRSWQFSLSLTADI